MTTKKSLNHADLLDIIRCAFVHGVNIGEEKMPDWAESPAYEKAYTAQGDMPNSIIIKAGKNGFFRVKVTKLTAARLKEK